MIDPAVLAALQAATPGDLLPRRAQARVPESGKPTEVVDVLDLGTYADGVRGVVALIGVGDRVVVAPGRCADGLFTRDAAVAAWLVPGTHGRFTVEIPAGAIPTGSARPIDVDQSNDSVVLDDVLVKWQVDALVSPAPARLRALEGSAVTPPLRAIVTWRDAHGDERLLLTAAQALPHAQDGWTWAVDLVRSAAQGATVDALGPVRKIGRITAEMHLRLAELGTGSWGPAELRALHEACIARLDDALSLIDGVEGARLQARESAMRAQLDSLLAIDATPVMATHGDLHIGQVLRYGGDGTDDGMAIIDFDGNPVLSTSERLALQPAARDVAGMLASLDHVARVVLHRTEDLDRENAVDWIPEAQGAFLASYRATLDAAGRPTLLDDRLLPALLVDQECREFVYAARFLPHWRYVPDAVITAMFPEEG